MPGLGPQHAAYFAEQAGLTITRLMFVQIPHHGSRRNVGPTILNRLVGPIQSECDPLVSLPSCRLRKRTITHPAQDGTQCVHATGRVSHSDARLQEGILGGVSTRPGLLHRRTHALRAGRSNNMTEPKRGRTAVGWWSSDESTQPDYRRLRPESTPLPGAATGGSRPP